MMPTGQTETEQYDAFICYSRKDIDFARRLEKALEAYKPPRDLKAPPRYLQIFRDEGDLTGVEYSQSIERNIQNSAKLMVICSPAARQSQYVNDEIRRFAQAKGAENIIPLIVSGIPNNEAKPEQTADLAFPEALCEVLKMPLAVSYLGFDPAKDKVDKGDYSNSWYTLLANLYNLSRNEIERRDLKRRLRRRNIAIAIVSSVMICLAGLAAYAWMQAKISKSRELAAASLNQLNVDPELSILLAVEAAGHSHTTQAESALRQALIKSHVRAVLTGHKKAVDAAIFSHDGKKVLTASDDGTIGVWEVTTGKRLLELPKPEGFVGMFFSDGDRQIVAVDDSGTRHAWDSVTGKPASFSGNKKISTSAALWRKDEVPKTTGGKMRLRDCVSKQVLEVPAGEMTEENARDIMAVSPDIKLLVTSSDYKIFVWDAETGKKLAILQGCDNYIIAIDRASFSPDSSKLVTTPKWLTTESGGGRSPSIDKTVTIWEAKTGEEKVVLRGHTGMVKNAFFSPNGRLVVTSSDDGTARVWDAETGRELAIMRGHQGKVGYASFNPQGTQIVTASLDNTARVWDAVSGQDTKSDIPKEHWFALSPQGTLFIGGSDKDDVHYPSFSPDGNLVVTTTNRDLIEVRKADTGEIVHVLKIPPDLNEYFPRAALSPDGQRLAITGGDVAIMSGDNKVMIFNLISCQLEKVLDKHEGPVYCAAFNMDGSLLATGDGDWLVRIWEVATGNLLHTLSGHQEIILSMVFGPDNSLLTGSRDNTGIIWPVKSRENPIFLRGHDNSVISVAFSPDGQMAVTVCEEDKTVRIWEVATGKQLAMLGGFAGYPVTATFTPDGSYLVSLTDQGNVSKYYYAVNGSISELLKLARTRISRKFTPEERKLYLP